MCVTYLTFANFTKTYDHVNTLLGPLPGTWKGNVQVTGPEAYWVLSFTVNPPLQECVCVHRHTFKSQTLLQIMHHGKKFIKKFCTNSSVYKNNMCVTVGLFRLTISVKHITIFISLKLYSQVLRELSFNFRDCNVLSGLALWAPLGAAAGMVMRSVSARCKARQLAAPAGQLQQTVMRCALAGSRRCVADRLPVTWQVWSAKVSWWSIMLYTLLLAVPGQVSPLLMLILLLLEVCQADYSFWTTWVVRMPSFYFGCLSQAWSVIG